MAYILYFNFKETVFEYPLPSFNNRAIEIDLSSIKEGKSLRLEVFDKIWKLPSSDEYTYTANGEKVSEKVLRDDDKIIISDKNSNLKFVVIVNYITDNTTAYRKWSLKEKNEIAIGRDSSCHIKFPDDDMSISRVHAYIRKNGANYLIVDNKSKNGTYLNGIKLCTEKNLEIFDTIYVVGLKIIFMGEFIAVNRMYDIAVNLPEADISDSEYEPFSDESHFSRSPRRIEPFDSEAIEIEAPPQKPSGKEQPLLFVVGPSVTMPLPIMLSMIFNMTMNSGVSGPKMYIGTIISVVCSALIGTGWAIAHRKYNKKTRKEDEEARTEHYGEYIEKNEQLLIDKHEVNKRILNEKYYSSNKIANEVVKNKTFLWNRNINHDDFMRIRLGTGCVKLPNQISVPKERFSMESDELADKPRELFDKYNTMKDCAATYRLTEQKIWGIIGDAHKIGNIVNNIILQVSALHSYTDVRVAVLCKNDEKIHYSWSKWLPHIFSSDKKLRMLGCDENSYQNILYHLSEELRNRNERVSENNNQVSFAQRYVVVCTDKDILDNSTINKYITDDKDLGFTFILAYGQLDKLPNECKVIIQDDDAYSGVYSLSSAINETNAVKFDIIGQKSLEKFSRAISGFYITEFGEGEIPVSVDYLDMIGIGRYEQWDLIKKYKENRSYESMASFIGLSAGNRPVYLDICEKKHGPHGLVAGTTGSGKSETLQTYILSLIMNYSPDEVAFILIDYKGGGMAAAFSGIPHLAGIITNLGSNNESDSIDENLTRRALISIKSEIKRRQMIFNKQKINHVDQYIRLHRRGEVTEALPHLIIISDEFAELKREQPEFIKELVSAARVGRSLGIHLILATQKPSGVVDEEIWSNSRFKVCLKVQDKQDSMGMLKRPEAAYLVNTGRAYMQIGNDEIFEMFQSGYSGAPYTPSDDFVSAKDDEVIMIGIDGTYLEHSDSRKKKVKTSVTQLKAGVEYIIKTTKENGIKEARRLWKEPLSKTIGLDDIETKNISFSEGLFAVVGMIDNPEKQSQYPAIIDISKTSHIAVYGTPGSGKTTFAHTILYSLITRYSPEEFNFYFIDFSARTSKKFRNAPHCGGIVFSEDEEAITRLFSLLDDEIKIRQQLFDDENVGSYAEYVKINKIPMIMVCIDNYAGFSEQYEEISLKLMSFSANCLKYGIQFFITASRTDDIKYKVKQNIGYQISLRQQSKSEYRDILGNTPEFVPSVYPGRGIISEDGLLEFQTAIPFAKEEEQKRSELMINEFEKLSSKYDFKAKKIPCIPKDEVYSEFFSNNISENYIPMGYDVSDISVLGTDMKNTFCYAVGANRAESISLVLNNITESSKKNGAEVFIVDTKNKVKNSDEKIKVYKTKDIPDLYELILEKFKRTSEIKRKLKSEGSSSDIVADIVKEDGMLVVVIDDFYEFCKEVISIKELRAFDNTSKFYEDLFEEFFIRGNEQAVMFVAGINSDSDGDMNSKPLFKNFMKWRTGITLGGHIDTQKAFSEIIAGLNYKQKMVEFDYNIGYIYDKNESHMIYIPKN